MNNLNRRSFLKTSGLSIPGILVAPSALDHLKSEDQPISEPIVKMYGDGETFDGPAYWEQLQKYHAVHPILADRYGTGGAVEELEKRFGTLTGKEKAIYMPSGTMANQLAISVLSGENTKVYVQDTSHVYRDEADAAQSVFNKRLMPLAKDEPYFTGEQLHQAISNLGKEEVFASGIGCVSIENPVRRADGRYIPLEELKKIRLYCLRHNIKTHLDGARLYMASAWSGVNIQEYSQNADTVYISLYKYLGASGGAILCGDKEVIDKMPHLIKIHGGNMYGNWLNAAMALSRLDGLENRLQQAIERSRLLFSALNSSSAVKIENLDQGTNIYRLILPTTIQAQKFAEVLNTNFFIRIPRPDVHGVAMISVNETILYREPTYLVNAFMESLKASR